jgi:hypothetical protein
MINGAISFDPSSIEFYTMPTIPAPPTNTGAPKATTVAPFHYWRDTLNYYSYLHQHLDGSIGRILEEIEAMPKDERPIVVFTSDHGEYAGSHGLRGKGYTGFRESTQVPLYVYDSQNISGFEVGDRAGLSSSVDLLPLLASLANGEPDDWRSIHPEYETLWRTRLDLYSKLFVPGAAGRDFVLHTFDEPVVQEDPDGNQVRYHMVSYRSSTDLICGYFTWNETAQIINYQSGLYQSFAQTDPLELSREDATPAQIQMLASAIQEELRAKMTSSLEDVARAANAARAIYNQSKVSDAIPGIVWDVVDW